jgi:hypothetical protein
MSRKQIKHNFHPKITLRMCRLIKQLITFNFGGHWFINPSVNITSSGLIKHSVLIEGVPNWKLNSENLSDLYPWLVVLHLYTNEQKVNIIHWMIFHTKMLQNTPKCHVTVCLFMILQLLRMIYLMCFCC